MPPARSLLALVLLAAAATPGAACTIFMSSQGGQVLVGNSEDWLDCHTRMRFIPAAEGAYGRVYFGFRIAGIQGGMNDQGLFFDFTALPGEKVIADPKKEAFRGSLIDKMMRECGSVAEALRLLQKYQWPWRGSCLLADKTGASAIVEPDDVVLMKDGEFQVSTNFRQSQTKPGAVTCRRYLTATKMLAAGKPSVESFRDILEAVAARGTISSQYSTVFDLKAGEFHVWHFHNFKEGKRFNLRDELAKGDRAYELGGLFPANDKFKAFQKQFDDALAKQAKDEKFVAAIEKGLERMIESCDQDGDGKLSMAELGVQVFVYQEVDGPALARFDQDGDKKFDRQELKQALVAFCPAMILALAGQ